MEERYGNVSRWLTGLSVLFIPLSILILSSVPLSYNFQLLLSSKPANSWIRFLLFASWILITLAIIAGIANLLSPLSGEEGEEVTEAKASSLEEGEEAGMAEVESTVVMRPKNKMSMVFTTLMAQAVLFTLGIILYVAYISWLVLPAVSPQALY
ncbi:MAG: hypothetical protein A2W01_09295 [Candidatus Solincola sediminis]|uniref:Transmembrane protein n=1 Tax=Candidatus Solincola sediminis TaxID=1797199 RepID=A0A1F2WH48_9ACTN|nr:MAG: hypothetical protein A2Y75_03315 [Candidatus Solincola sediminis]OFW60432.1 MAG: hypothetical protein A2W01_09295 [Candidatus Solincola sediminis]